MNTEKYKKSYITIALIAVNILYFLFLELHGSTETDMEMMLKYGASFEPLIVEEHQYYRLLTACFMHFGMAHLANNMLVLFILGCDLEELLGHVKYLILYLVCGVGANIISVYMGESFLGYSISAGASGAIFGIVGGLLTIVIRNHGYAGGYNTRQLFLYIILSIYMGMGSTGVDNSAHIGGLIIGLLVCLILYRPRRRKNIYA